MPASPDENNQHDSNFRERIEFEWLFDSLDDVFIDVIQLEGFTNMLKVLEQFKDKKGRIDFDYIETYVRKKAYDIRKNKDAVDDRLREILDGCPQLRRFCS